MSKDCDNILNTTEMPELAPSADVIATKDAVDVTVGVTEVHENTSFVSETTESTTSEISCNCGQPECPPECNCEIVTDNYYQ